MSSLITKETPAAAAQKAAEHSQLAMTAPPAGHQHTRIHESADGNPGRPVRVAELMGFDFPARVSWLAFCSGPSLKREDFSKTLEQVVERPVGRFTPIVRNHFHQFWPPSRRWALGPTFRSE